MSRVETKRKINGVRINVKLHNGKETVLSTTRKGKTNLLKVLQGSSELIWDSGYVRVTYNKDKEFYNHCVFFNMDQLVSLLGEFLDPYLVKQFA
jgi:hypothetical protein